MTGIMGVDSDVNSIDPSAGTQDGTVVGIEPSNHQRLFLPSYPIAISPNSKFSKFHGGTIVRIGGKLV